MARRSLDLVATIPKALKALAAMERELEAAETYTAIRKIARAAEALKHLLGEVAEVKQKAEWVVLAANIRIGEEIKKVPKASGGDQRSKLPRRVNSESGRAALGVPGTSRARLQKLAGIGVTKAKAMAEELWAAGKDATVKAVLGENRSAEITRMREAYRARAEQGGTMADLEKLIAAGKTFGVICPDFPWEFEVYSGKGKQRSAERHYDIWSLERIKAFAHDFIPRLAAKDCALLLWSVWPEHPGALEVIAACGFDYKTAGFIWVKTNPGVEVVTLAGKGLFTGMGYATRSNTEACLLATRGSPQRLAQDVHQVVIAPVAEHSAKPDEVYRRIERLYPGPYLELFARKPREHWTSWGDEIAAYDAADDMWRSYADCLTAVRERVAGGGKTWEPR